MKKHLLLIITLINAAVTALYIALLPKAEIPMHYNALGNADRYGSKWELMIMPLALFLPVIIYYVYSFFKSEDEDGKNRMYIKKVVWGLFIVLFVLFWVLIFTTSNGADKIGTLAVSLIFILFGALMAYIGNFYGKIKQNSMLGIKTHATLKSENVWRKTHRLSGYLAVLSGIIWIIGGVVTIFLNQLSAVVFIPCLAVMLLLMFIIPLIYSELLYHKEKTKNEF